MEMCHHLPNTNADEVTNALKLGSRRLVSPAYLTGGMGDGGG
jgi:UDPglucose 6-dehydrogenase